MQAQKFLSKLKIFTKLKNIILFALVALIMKIKCFEEKHLDLLLNGEKRRRQHVLIKNFNILMYDHLLHCKIKIFCSYCLQAFNTEDISKSHVNESSINGKQTNKITIKSDYARIKNYEKKWPLTIYEDFESILLPEDIGK